MDATQDPKYLQLYRDYAKAIHAYSNAVESRRKVRASLDAKRRKPPPAKGPIKQPPTHARPASAGRSSERKIYMGEILGWATLAPTATLEPKSDPAADFDIEKLYDEISLGLYWNAKIHYQKCKKEFFDYVRLRNIELHRERAQSALSHAANLQVLGIESADETALEEAKKEVERACQNAWNIYQTSATPKSYDAKVLLFENVAEAQFVGLDDSATVKAMQTEVERLLNM